MDDFEQMKKALENGEIVAIEKDEEGKLFYGGSFKNDNDAVLSYSADNPEDADCLPEVLFITKKRLHPSFQL